MEWKKFAKIEYYSKLNNKMLTKYIKKCENIYATYMKNTPFLCCKIS